MAAAWREANADKIEAYKARRREESMREEARRLEEESVTRRVRTRMHSAWWRDRSLPYPDEEAVQDEAVEELARIRGEKP